MVVMAFLNGTHFAFKANNCRAILAQHAGGRWHLTKGGVLTLFRCNVAMFTIIKGKDLFAVAADPTIGRGGIAGLFGNPFGKGLKHLGVIAQITCLDECNVRMLSRDLIRETVNPVDQDA